MTCKWYCLCILALLAPLGSACSGTKNDAIDVAVYADGFWVKGESGEYYGIYLGEIRPFPGKKGPQHDPPYPVPPIYAKAKDGTVVKLTEMTPEFAAKQFVLKSDKGKGDDGEHEDFREGGESAQFTNGKLISLISAGFSFGPSENGPWVRLPCSVKRFEEVFGPPQSTDQLKNLRP